MELTITFLPEIYTRVLPPTEHSFFANPRELVYNGAVFGLGFVDMDVPPTKGNQI